MNASSEAGWAVVGGGLVGSLASIFLARRGFEVTVFERSPDIRDRSATGGRSINLVIASRGIRALEMVGLERAALALTVPVMGRMMHSATGALSFQPYGRDESECNYSISRAELNGFLIDEAERRGVRFEFNRRLVDADLAAGRLEFEVPGHDGRLIVEARHLIGADGAASAVRAALVRMSGFDESMELLDHGYKELTISAAPDGGFRIDKHALHIWPRGRIMLMALPNQDGSFTATIYMPRRGEAGFEGLDTEAKVRELFDTHFADAVPLIPALEKSFLSRPVGELGTVRSRPWHLGDRVMLMGDAAHAIVPFFGQGMNAGFEDCRVLDELLDEHDPDRWDRILPAYSVARKPDADAIANMALDNFVEMRDRVGDPRFLLRKQVEHLLEQNWPGEYRSRYSMVMYGSRIPYRVAREAGVIQQRILDALCGGIEAASDVDLPKARRLIRENLTPFLEHHGVKLDY